MAFTAQLKKYGPQFYPFSVGAIASLLGLLTLSTITHATAEEQPVDTSTLLAPLNLEPRLRIRSFTEFMTPAFQGHTDSVPSPDGTPFLPSNLFNILWADYEIGNNLRIVYWQRTYIFLTSNPEFQGFQVFPRDPRFAVRFTQVFNNPNLTTTYDAFFQPQLTNNVGIFPQEVTRNIFCNRNILELGFRTNTTYQFPGSRWSIGMVQEWTNAFFGGKGPRYFGWANPWVNYQFSKAYSVQSAFFFPIQNKRADQPDHITWDVPGGAYVQNGFSMSVNDRLSVSLLLNNYLFEPLSWRNTWMSVWVSLAFL